MTRFIKTPAIALFLTLLLVLSRLSLAFDGTPPELCEVMSRFYGEVIEPLRQVANESEFRIATNGRDLQLLIPALKVRVRRTLLAGVFPIDVVYDYEKKIQYLMINRDDIPKKDDPEAFDRFYEGLELLKNRSKIYYDRHPREYEKPYIQVKNGRDNVIVTYDRKDVETGAEQEAPPGGARLKPELVPGFVIDPSKIEQDPAPKKGTQAFWVAMRKVVSRPPEAGDWVLGIGSGLLLQGAMYWGASMVTNGFERGLQDWPAALACGVVSCAIVTTGSANRAIQDLGPEWQGKTFVWVRNIAGNVATVAFSHTHIYHFDIFDPNHALAKQAWGDWISLIFNNAVNTVSSHGTREFLRIVFEEPRKIYDQWRPQFFGTPLKVMNVLGEVAAAPRNFLKSLSLVMDRTWSIPLDGIGLQHGSIQFGTGLVFQTAWAAFVEGAKRVAIYRSERIKSTSAPVETVSANGSDEAVIKIRNAFEAAELQAILGGTYRRSHRCESLLSRLRGRKSRDPIDDSN